MDKFFEIHKDIPREGPGDNQSTKKALDKINVFTENDNILDIGCGPGIHTIELAKNTNASIKALDIFDHFLDSLRKHSKINNVECRIKTIKGSMFELDKYFDKESFNLIWSEGAIYIIGFERGLKEWKNFIKPNGHLVVSEATWLKDDLPEEIKDFWNSEYPEMKTIEENLDIIKKQGYNIVDYFTIPESSWWDNYYTPLQNRINILEKEHKEDKNWLNVLYSTKKEINMYRKYSDYYGYVFYIMKK